MLLGGAGETHRYHVVSRVVDRQKVFGDAEREHLRELLERQLEFSGLRAIAWCFMGNHLHLLLEVPDKEAALDGWDEEQLIERLGALSSESFTRKLLADVEMWRENGNHEALAKVAESVRARLFDLSRFMKEFKHKFSTWYNRRHQRRGTLWEERFLSVLVQGGDALRTVSAYIDLNPIRAGIVADPGDYRWCSYAAAVAGNSRAREAVRRACGERRQRAWRRVVARYRMLLYDKGEQQPSEHSPDKGYRAGRLGFTRSQIEEVIRRGGRLPLGAALRCRIRYFTEGVALGDEAFLESFFEDKRGSGLFGERRETGSREMVGAEWGDLRTLRNLSRGLL
jgi:REP element-mobilizing transposase RayT